MDAPTMAGERYVSADAIEPKPAKKTAKAKDVKPADDSSESCCTRVWEAVKSAFIALVYYITCCKIDLSRNKRLFEGVSSITCLTSLPKEEDKTEIVKLIGDAVKASGIDKGHQKETIKPLTDKRFVAEIHQVLVAAFEGGLNPLEYRLSFDRYTDVISLEIFAPEEFDTDKLPTFEASSKKLKGVVSAAKWGKADQVTVSAGEGKEAKDITVKCKSCRVEFRRNELPKSAAEEKADIVEQEGIATAAALEAEGRLTRMRDLNSAVKARLVAAQAAKATYDQDGNNEPIRALSSEQMWVVNAYVALERLLSENLQTAEGAANLANTAQARASKERVARILEEAKILSAEIEATSPQIWEIINEVNRIEGEKEKQKRIAAENHLRFLEESQQALARWSPVINRELDKTAFTGRELTDGALAKFAVFLARLERSLHLTLTEDSLVGYPEEQYTYTPEGGQEQVIVVASGFAICFPKGQVPDITVGAQAKSLFDELLFNDQDGIYRYTIQAENATQSLWNNFGTPDEKRQNSWCFYLSENAFKTVRAGGDID